MAIANLTLRLFISAACLLKRSTSSVVSTRLFSSARTSSALSEENALCSGPVARCAGCPPGMDALAVIRDWNSPSRQIQSSASRIGNFRLDQSSRPKTDQLLLKSISHPGTVAKDPAGHGHRYASIAGKQVVHCNLGECRQFTSGTVKHRTGNRIVLIGSLDDEGYQ